MTGQRLSRHRVGGRDRQCVGNRDAESIRWGATTLIKDNLDAAELAID
jgi:hypothetical protein